MRSITCNTWDFTKTETNNNNNNKPNVKHLKNRERFKIFHLFHQNIHYRLVNRHTTNLRTLVLEFFLRKQPT